MPLTDEEKKLDPSVRRLFRELGVVAFWGVTYASAIQILKHHPQTVWLRGAAVALAIAGFATWLVFTARAIRSENEFTRRIHLVALSIAFAVTALFLFVSDMLQRAGFLDYVSLMTIFMVMLASWWISIVIAMRYYR